MGYFGYNWIWFLLFISSQNRFPFCCCSMCVVILHLPCLVGTNNIPRLDLPFYNVPWQLLRFMEELESIQLLFSHSKNSLTQQTRVDDGLCCNGFHSWHDSSKNEPNMGIHTKWCINFFPDKSCTKKEKACSHNDSSTQTLECWSLNNQCFWVFV